MKAEYVFRRLEGVLARVIRQFPAVAISGPRQSGKSTLLRNVFGKDYAVISFDDPVTRERAVHDPGLLIQSSGDKIIFDEIQYAPHILSYVKMLIDDDRHAMDEDA